MAAGVARKNVFSRETMHAQPAFKARGPGWGHAAEIEGPSGDDVTMRDMCTTNRPQCGLNYRGSSFRILATLALAIAGCETATMTIGQAPALPERSVIFVRVPGASGPQAGACWQDFAFLAAVPAATKCNEGMPAVIALDESCTVTREIDDYLRRYKPQSMYCLGSPAPRVSTQPATTQPAVVQPAPPPLPPSRPWTTLAAESAESAAWTLATTFWQSADKAVICDANDYASALTASSLAGRLRAPLLYSTNQGVCLSTTSCLKRFGVKKALVVGRAGKAAEQLKSAGMAVVQLADAPAVLNWMRQERIPVTYLAVANPDDRDAQLIRKLSLTAPLLASARGGLAVPLAYKAVWKAGFTGAECKDGVPKGTPDSKKPAHKGTLSVNGKEVAFVVTGRGTKDYDRVNFDLNGNGEFGDGGEGPFRAGDVVTLGGLKCSVSLGQTNGVGKADIRITTPCAEQVLSDLRALYAAMGHAPTHLCIVAMPDGIPQAIVPEGAGEGSNRDLCSDFPFTNADDDVFGEVAVGRVTAENATFATLYASRVITYRLLLDSTWSDKAGQARWENSYDKLFENVGFAMAPHHDVDKLRWIEKPAGKSRGKRAKGFDQDSPLASVAAIAHTDHSWWHEIGHTYDWDSDVLLAPVLVESGGCLTTALDRQADFHSVVARLMRNGAVGFLGNALPATAFQEQQRLMFWNSVLAGRTTGQAQLDASNGAVAVMLETGQQRGGPNHYMLYLCGLFGDPGFTMHVPSRPKSAPARVAVKDDVVSVYAPAEWWPCRIRVPEDWKLWTDKDLYVLRGAGTWPNRHWIGAGYDAEETYVWATIRTDRKVKGIRQVQSPAKPLGWTGKFVVDENADGTRTYMWRVRLVDFDQQKGTITAKVDRLDYEVTFEPR